MSENLVARDQLRSIIERIERLHEERKAIADDIRDVYGEAKANGLDTKVMKKIVADRSKDKCEIEEFNAIYDLYAKALGMLPDFESGTEVATRVHAHETHPAPHSPVVDGGQPKPSTDPNAQKADACMTSVEQGGEKPIFKDGQSEQQSTPEAQASNEAGSVEGVSATNPPVPAMPDFLKRKKPELAEA